MSTNFQVGFVSQKNSSKVLKPPGGGTSTDIFAGNVVDSASTPRSINNHMKSNIFAAPSPIRANQSGDGRRAPADSHNRLFGDVDRAGTPAKNRLKSNIPIGGDDTDASLKHSNGVTNGNGHTNSSREHIGSENGKSSGDYKENYNEKYSHSTDNLDSSKYYGIDIKAANYLNPTYNSKISLCINDDYISISDNVNNNNRSPSGVRPENVNSRAVTTLMLNANESKFHRNTFNSPLSDGNSLNGNGEAKPSGENLAPSSNHVVNKNRIPPGGFSSGLW